MFLQFPDAVDIVSQQQWRLGVHREIKDQGSSQSNHNASGQKSTAHVPSSQLYES